MDDLGYDGEGEVGLTLVWCLLGARELVLGGGRREQ